MTGDSWLLLQVQILRANSAAGVLLEEIDAELAQVRSFWGPFSCVWICACRGVSASFQVRLRRTHACLIRICYFLS